MERLEMDLFTKITKETKLSERVTKLISFQVSREFNLNLN